MGGESSTLSAMSSRDRALRRALQALAQPASIQLALFPELASPGDEMARLLAQAVRQAEVVKPELELTLARLEARFVEHGGPGHADFWDDLTDSRWHEIRQLAEAALRASGWAVAKPQPYDR